MGKHATIICFLFIVFNATAQQGTFPQQPVDSLEKEAAKIKSANREKAAATQWQYFIVGAGNNTYGYDIYADGGLYIHQSTIPAVQGKHGFADTASAGATARLAIQKIKEGEMPPTITIGELRKIKVVE